jgi:hypothetical protein
VLKATADLGGYVRPNEQINDPKTAKIGNPVAGSENLAGWTVTVDGVQVPGVAIFLRDGFLKAAVLKGTCILFR